MKLCSSERSWTSATTPGDQALGPALKLANRCEHIIFASAEIGCQYLLGAYANHGISSYTEF
jgi:hypothetical protein